MNQAEDFVLRHSETGRLRKLASFIQLASYYGIYLFNQSHLYYAIFKVEITYNSKHQTINADLALGLYMVGTEEALEHGIKLEFFPVPIHLSVSQC